MIEATPNHPFFVHGTWFKVKDLVSGDTLKTFAEDGELIVIDSLIPRVGKFTVYNFTVKDYHTYYVGQGEVLVHNCGNSKKSTKAQHLYEIFEQATMMVVKTGVSGGRIAKNGKSYRATSQVNKWNAAEGAGKYNSRVVKTRPKGKGARQKILNDESNNATRLIKAGHLQDFNKHKRPR